MTRRRAGPHRGRTRQALSPAKDGGMTNLGPAPSTGSPLVASGLTKVYGTDHTATHALAGVSLTVSPGESVAIMAASFSAVG